MNYIYKTEPRKYQRNVTEKALSSIYKDFNRFFGLFMWMGTGKSKTAIDIVSNLYLDNKIDAVLLIAPNGIQRQWISEQVPEHCPVKHYPFLWSNKKSKSYLHLLDRFLRPESNKPVELTTEVVGNSITGGLNLPEITDDDKADFKRLDNLWDDMEDDDIKEDINPDHVYLEPFTNQEPVKMIEQEDPITTEYNQDDLIIREDKKELKWFFVNVERFSTKDKKPVEAFFDYCKNNKVAIILDEATRIKTPTAQRTKMVLELAKRARYKFALTGTLVTNSPFDAFSIGTFLKSDLWNCNFFIFKARYGMMIKDMNQNTGRSFQRLMAEKEFRIVKWHLSKGNSQSDTAAITGISEKNIKWNEKTIIKITMKKTKIFLEIIIE